jgi:nucleotide-binding universal stress UspA family protein
VPDRIRSVVVPVTGGANSQLAAELAGRFAAQFDTTARALTVIPAEVSENEAAALEKRARKTLEEAGSNSALTVIRRRNVGAALVRALRPDELVLIGAPSTDPVAALLAETFPNLVARRGHNPMIIVRDVEAHRSGRFERFFRGRK